MATKTWWWFPLAAGVVLAQSTMLQVGQLRTGPPAPSPGATAATCVMVAVGGIGSCAVLDPSVTVAVVSGLPVISVTPAVVTPAPGPSSVFNEDYTAAAGQTAFPLANAPEASTVRVYRNGLRESPGPDYAVAGGTVTFTAGSAPLAGDAIAFDYQY